jgi:hypothetical protein
VEVSVYLTYSFRSPYNTIDCYSATKNSFQALHEQIEGGLVLSNKGQSIMLPREILALLIRFHLLQRADLQDLRVRRHDQ